MELLAKARELGVRVVRFADNLSLEGLSEAGVDAVIVQAEKWQMAIQVGTRDIRREHLRNYLALATRADSRLVRAIPEALGTEMCLEETSGHLLSSVPDLTAAEVKLAFENQGQIPVSELRPLVDEPGNPWVGICLDTVKSLGIAEGPEVVVKVLAPHTVNLHVKDFVVKRLSHQMGFTVEGTPAGKGQRQRAVVAGVAAGGRRLTEGHPRAVDAALENP